MTRYVYASRVKRSIKYIKMAELGFEKEEEFNDHIQNLTEEASRFIDSYCNRQNNYFKTGGISITEQFDGSGVSPPSGLYELSESAATWQEKAVTFYLTNRPVLSITKIEENNAAIGDADDWQEITKYRWTQDGEIILAEPPGKGRKNIRITYKAGYSTVPPDIRMACSRLVINYIQKQLSDKTAGFTSFLTPKGVSFSSVQVLTSDVKTVLDKYRTTGWGEM